jgi:ABC-type glycerol-3-phosphate transport system substrate-binding protein
MTAQTIFLKKMLLTVICLAFALALAGCGKKPKDVSSPDETVTFPTQYPTSR